MDHGKLKKVGRNFRVGIMCLSYFYDLPWFLSVLIVYLTKIIVKQWSFIEMDSIFLFILLHCSSYGRKNLQPSNRHDCLHGNNLICSLNSTSPHCYFFTHFFLSSSSKSTNNLLCSTIANMNIFSCLNQSIHTSFILKFSLVIKVINLDFC